MEKYVFYCPTCNQFFSKETDNPNDVPKCEICKKFTKYIGITKEEWDAKQGKEKEDFKNSIKISYQNANTNIQDDGAILSELKKISHDIHNLYCIIVGMLVLNIIAGILLCFIQM